MFSGRVPDLSRLRKLTYLALDDNSLTGSLPFPLFALPFLDELLLSFNQFSGTLSEFPHALSFPIRVMTLGSNKLEGPLALSLFNFQNLNILDLSFNNFSGSVELSNLKKLEHLTTLDLSYNNLSIASGSSNLTWFANGIRELDLASCKLTSFPNLVNRSGLDYLDLSNNQIHGKIPVWIWNVNHVNLSYNLLEGFERPLPSNHSANFTLIDLHHNMLTGPLLPVLPRGAYYIDYSDNRLTSTIPIDIGDYVSFTIFLSLSMNQISGTIPLSMCNATNLEILDLSGNGLGGTIPQCLFNTSSHLAIVNLSANKLKGVVPGMFSQGCALRTLDLSYNMFEGEIPRTLATCAGLEVLNLAQNKIHDKFPCWLKGLPNLHVLVLRSNKLTGAVQCSDTMNLNLWRSLQILDLAHNKLFGALPSEFFLEWNPMMEENSTPKQLMYTLSYQDDYYMNKVTVFYKGMQIQLVKILTVFTLVDLSSNMFNGEIPETIGRQSAVHGLNLSHNVLTGQIPSTLGSMKVLESLDFSHNSLNGSIPEQLGKLNFLEWLNLSFNQLEGKIPSGGQFQTFQESAFLGNKGLCGSPLNVKCSDYEGSSSSPDYPKVASKLSHAGFLMKLDFMVGSEVGFIFGLVITIGPLALYPRWSRYYHRHLDSILLSAFGIRPNRGRKRYVSIIR